MRDIDFGLTVALAREWRRVGFWKWLRSGEKFGGGVGYWDWRAIAA